MHTPTQHNTTHTVFLSCQNLNPCAADSVLSSQAGLPFFLVRKITIGNNKEK